MLEYWSLGMLRMCFHRSSTPVLQYSNTPILQYSIAPLFRPMKLLLWTHRSEELTVVDNEQATSQAQGLTFEQCFAKLERIVHQLEEGQLGLSESLAHYEEAVTYLKLCHQTLREAERRIALLTGVDTEGNPSRNHLMMTL